MKPTGLFLCASFALGSCSQGTRDRLARDRGEAGVVSVSVALTAGDPGTPDAPRPYSARPVSYNAAITVHGSDPAAPLAGFDGWVAVSVSPGVLANVQGAAGTVVAGRNVHLVGGRGEVTVSFVRAYGETRIWAEEDGYVPALPGAVAQCANGLDDDGDGRADYPADYGCAAPNDDSESGGSYANAASGPMYFASPTLNEIQGGGATSPLVNERVAVNRGRLVVTRISVSGFWVTDVADRSCPDPAAPTDPTRNKPCFNSIFSFNFRLPEGLRPCDRLDQIQGSVQEFVGTTQFGQPAWNVTPGGLWVNATQSGACGIPDALLITPAMLDMADVTLEPLESGIVRAEGLAFPTTIGPAKACTGSGATLRCAFQAGQSSCDLNRDGRVDYNDADEAACGNQCQALVGCSEWTSWHRFGTMLVDFRDGSMPATRLSVSPREALPDLDPQRPPATDPAGFTATGTLKQVGPNWIIEPRCTQDVVLTGAPLPANASCLLPRAVEGDPGN